jgi:hypothetical protein
MPHHMDPSQLSPSARQVFKLIEFDADERLQYEIRKHWFGLFLIYFVGSFVIATLLAVSLGAGLIQNNDFVGASFSTLQLLIISLSLLLAVLVASVTAISAYLYRTNVIIVTSEKLAQLLNPTLFHRKISQLSIGDIQDATVVQRGVFPHMFNYGTIVIETAGEQQNYTFTYAPNPYECAKAIVGAHEENLKLHGN